MIVYTSPFSSIEDEPGRGLLTVTWFKECISLDEEGVISELTRILDHVKEYSIVSIIVDSRDYPFRENDRLQHWINHIYMPQIMDRGVQRYAIIVHEKVKSILEELPDLTDEDPDRMMVEYFTDAEQARQWITSDPSHP